MCVCVCVCVCVCASRDPKTGDPKTKKAEPMGPSIEPWTADVLPEKATKWDAMIDGFLSKQKVADEKMNETAWAALELDHVEGGIDIEHGIVVNEDRGSDTGRKQNSLPRESAKQLAPK